MSAETTEWLNTMTLIGFTDKRGTAWHYRAEAQGSESNHYPMAVPVDDVERRLFNFTVEDSPLYIMVNGEFGPEYIELVDRKAMTTSDTHDVLGIFKDGYQGHSYSEWLLQNVSHLLDDNLAIGSAGLLRNRAQAWVSVEVPENSVIKLEGKDDDSRNVVYRPNLLATTSFDGSIATTYKRVVTNVVCDNTLSAGLNEKGSSVKVKHTRYSNLRITSAREALDIVFRTSEDFEREVRRLYEMEMTDNQWEHLLDVTVPFPTDGNKRGTTVANDKRIGLNELYRWDARVAPWQGTAYGALQAFNTFAHHKSQVRKGVHRGQRNAENAVNGKTEQVDSSIIAAIDKVLVSA